MINFWKHCSTSRAFGFPFWWSVRTAWGWRQGPNETLVAMRNSYLAATKGNTNG